MGTTTSTLRPRSSRPKLVHTYVRSTLSKKQNLPCSGLLHQARCCQSPRLKPPLVCQGDAPHEDTSPHRTKDKKRILSTTVISNLLLVMRRKPFSHVGPLFRIFIFVLLTEKLSFFARQLLLQVELLGFPARRRRPRP